MGAGVNGNNQWEWEGNGNKTPLNLGLGLGMGINYWEWRGMGLKKIFPLISSWLSDLLQRELKMKLLEVEGDVPQCPIAGDATERMFNHLTPFHPVCHLNTVTQFFHIIYSSSHSPSSSFWPPPLHSVSGWTRGVQVKLWDRLRTRAIPERLRGVFTTRRYTNPRLLLPYLTRGVLNKDCLHPKGEVTGRNQRS